MRLRPFAAARSKSREHVQAQDSNTSLLVSKFAHSSYYRQASSKRASALVRPITVTLGVHNIALFFVFIVADAKKYFDPPYALFGK